MDVAIIGAGLCGLTLGLALRQKGIKSTIFEMRSAPLNVGGGVMLSPNALRILDYLGVYERVRDKGVDLDVNDYVDAASGRVIEQQEFGSKDKYGYRGMRIFRYVLIETLLQMLREQGVQVKYGYRFAKIVRETSRSVAWQWKDGSQAEAALLIGADGIHSTVRKYLYPEVEEEFMFGAGITAAVSVSELKPASASLDKIITYTMPGENAVVISPQRSDIAEIFIGKQKRLTAEPPREEWKAHLDEHVAFLKTNNGKFPELVHDIAAHISPDRINIWPFYKIPKLDNWASAERRVIILGDAAHALPPSAGQGINQGFEDVYMFAALLAASGGMEKTGDDSPIADAIAFWHDYRMHRVEGVLKLNKQIEIRRALDAGEQVKKEPMELAWLYNADFNQVVNDYLAGKEAKEAGNRA